MGLSVDIYKSFKDFTLNVSFEVKKDILGILGASGSGKSMTLRCIAGLVTPDRGRIVLNGRELFNSEKGINLPVQERGLGFLFQNYALFPNLTVRENIAFGLRKLPKKEQNRRIEDKLKMMRLESLQDRYPHQLSGGQQQRTALARALVTEPECLLLDEPFSALDNHIRNQLEKELLDTLATFSGVTVFVTHNLEECYRVSKDILVMEKGRVSTFGSREDIFLHPPNTQVARLTGCKNISSFIPISADTVRAVDWGCNLTVDKKNKPSNPAYLGIREHHVTLVNKQDLVNTFPCWVAQAIEKPHTVTLYLSLNKPPVNPGDYQLEMEIYKERYAWMKDRPYPWLVQLKPEHLFFMEE